MALQIAEIRTVAILLLLFYFAKSLFLDHLSGTDENLKSDVKALLS